MNNCTLITRVVAMLLVLGMFTSFQEPSVLSSKFEVYKVDLAQQELAMYWKNESGVPLRNFSALQTLLKKQHKNLKFAMNGGMYHENGTPVGLYVENGKQLKQLDTASGSGNFYMKPNGVFFITSDRKAKVVEMGAYTGEKVKYATQSGPMLVLQNKIHPSFNKASTNVNIRNGVGVASSGEVYFVISKTKVTFYEMASFFKEELMCTDALYLDGYVSSMYLPARQWNDLGGNFGVMVGE